MATKRHGVNIPVPFLKVMDEIIGKYPDHFKSRFDLIKYLVNDFYKKNIGFKKK